VHVRARTAAICARRNFMNRNRISPITDANAQQLFMFHYPSSLLFGFQRREKKW
jgi:hypothetical protein